MPEPEDYLRIHRQNVSHQSTEAFQRMFFKQNTNTTHINHHGPQN